MTTSTAATRPEAKSHFAADTAGHEMTVLHDDGPYRHIKFRAPNTTLYWYDIITWPGHLTLTGDMGTWTFRRTADMFEFFRHPDRDYINPGYWSEKLQAGASSGPDTARGYSEDLYRRLVTEHIEGYADSYDLSDAQRRCLREAAHRELLDAADMDYPGGYMELARQAIDWFEHPIKPGMTFRFSDTWEWDMRGYSIQFLWSCHAIQAGIHAYDQRQATARLAGQTLAAALPAADWTQATGKAIAPKDHVRAALRAVRRSQDSAPRDDGL